MKLKQEMVDYLGKRVVDSLIEKKLLEVDTDDRHLKEVIAGTIAEDLRVEDNLNAEVKDVLDSMGDDLDNIDYRKMFQMVKNRYARERGLIL